MLLGGVCVALLQAVKNSAAASSQVIVNTDRGMVPRLYLYLGALCGWQFCKVMGNNFRKPP
jgi:hypothetical protein